MTTPSQRQRTYTPEEKATIVREYIRLRPTLGDVRAYRQVNHSSTILRKWAKALNIPIPKVDKSISMNIRNGNITVPSVP